MKYNEAMSEERSNSKARHLLIDALMIVSALFLLLHIIVHYLSAPIILQEEENGRIQEIMMKKNSQSGCVLKERLAYEDVTYLSVCRRNIIAYDTEGNILATSPLPASIQDFSLKELENMLNEPVNDTKATSFSLAYIKGKIAYWVYDLKAEYFYDVQTLELIYSFTKEP